MSSSAGFRLHLLPSKSSKRSSNVQEDILATYLKNEYPQTIAVVLSKIDTEHASKVLAALPEELAMNVVKRRLSLAPAPKQILEKIEQRPGRHPRDVPEERVSANDRGRVVEDRH